MSTHVRGFRPPDAKWEEMKAVWDSCRSAGVDPPKEVGEFFDWEDPDPAGIEVSLDGIAERWCEESRDGYQVELAKLPDNVTHIRFENSY